MKEQEFIEALKILADSVERTFAFVISPLRDMELGEALRSSYIHGSIYAPPNPWLARIGIKTEGRTFVRGGSIRGRLPNMRNSEQ